MHPGLASFLFAHPLVTGLNSTEQRFLFFFKCYELGSQTTNSDSENTMWVKEFCMLIVKKWTGKGKWDVSLDVRPIMNARISLTLRRTIPCWHTDMFSSEACGRMWGINRGCGDSVILMALQRPLRNTEHHQENKCHSLSLMSSSLVLIKDPKCVGELSWRNLWLRPQGRFRMLLSGHIQLPALWLFQWPERWLRHS